MCQLTSREVTSPRDTRDRTPARSPSPPDAVSSASVARPDSFRDVRRRLQPRARERVGQSAEDPIGDIRGVVPSPDPGAFRGKRAEPLDASEVTRVRSRRDVLHAGLAAAFAAVAAPSPRPRRVRRRDRWGRRRGRRAGDVLDVLRRRRAPATYGTLGGTTKDKAKYSYEVPSNWKEEAPTKVEKGAGGQDSRWVLVGSRRRRPSATASP